MSKRGRRPNLEQPARTVSIYVPDALYLQVRRVASAHGITMTELLRRGMQRLVASHDKKTDK